MPTGRFGVSRSSSEAGRVDPSEPGWPMCGVTRLPDVSCTTVLHPLRGLSDMRENLATASDLLASAAEDAGDHADRLHELSDQLDTLADQDRDVDHGRLARIQSGLAEVQPDLDDGAAATIDEANGEINAFRETIEGV